MVTTRFEGVHCAMEVARPARGIVIVTIRGPDAGELGRAPFLALDAILAEGRPIDLYIDARGTRGASVDVSQEWALWLHGNKPRLARVTMLTGSRLVQVSAEFVRRFAGLEDLMRLTTSPPAFDEALADAIRAASDWT